jgi:hypothetical protein
MQAFRQPGPAARADYHPAHVPLAGRTMIPGRSFPDDCSLYKCRYRTILKDKSVPAERNADTLGKHR